MFSSLFAASGLLVVAGLMYWALSPVLGTPDLRVEDGPAAAKPVATASADDPILVGAGDISSCGQENDELTAQLVDRVVAGATGEVVVFTAGDNAYEEGTIEQFVQCFEPTWGRHKARTRPALGNHEYHRGNADGYFQYFGASAGDPTRGYYSYDLGQWHIIVLNTNDGCALISCAAGSAQEQWLREDLKAHTAYCTLAIWHDPMFSSEHAPGSSRFVYPFWAALYEYGADVVVNGHGHNYERFALQTPDGVLDMDYGIREFVVGTGGQSHGHLSDPLLTHSEKADDTTYGVLKLALHPSSYDWEFIPNPKRTAFSDSGSEGCHRPPSS